MPLVRYEIRNEYSLARPNLYRSADKDDPDALLEGVSMASVVGIVRQLGDLAEFAAEIFHDLHEEIMATAARGHELMIRVQQLEAEVPLVEKAVMYERNQLCLAHRIGADWHASIRNDQNHLTHSDLPRFIRNSYEECRGPPRLFILDKFDVAGAGACLKRYTDPSFFKTEWASSKLRKTENAEREINTARLKKRIRRQRNGEITGVTVASQHNSRFYYSTLDLAGQMVVPGNLYCTSSPLLALEQPKEVPSAGLVHEDQTKNDLVIGQLKEFQSLKISGKDIEVTKMCSDTMKMQKEFSVVNGERKPLVEDDLGPINEVASEAENFVDALTIIESELETDSECQIKREVDSEINYEHRKAGSQVDTKLHELLAECSIFPDVQSCYSNKYEGDIADIKSSTPSEDSGSQSLSLPSLNASLQSGEKLQTAGRDCGNRDTMTADCVSSGSGNIVWTTNTPNVETEHDDNNVVPFASTSDAMPTTSTNFVQIPDAFLDRSSSFAFSNSELPSSVCHVHAFEDRREKESTADPNSANDCNVLVNSLSSVHSNIVQMTDSSAEALLDDDPDIKSFAITACDVAVTTFVQNHDAVLDRSSSFAFSNFESSNVPLNTTSSACFDNADALFKFVTPELSIMYSDAKFASSTLVEETLTISKSSAGVTGIEKVENSQPFIFEDSKRSESVSVYDAFEHKPGMETESSLVPLIPSDTCKTEVAACIDVPELGCDLHDEHDDHPCSELEASYAENEIQGDHVSGEKTFSEHESSSTTLPVCISVQSETEERHMESSIGILHGKHSTELCGELLASINAEVVEPSIDCESLGNQGLDFSSCKDTFQLKPVQICEKSSDPLVTATNINKVEFSPELQSFQVPNNGASAPLLATREFSSEMLGNKLISGIDNSKVDGAVFENDLNPDTLPKDIPVDLIHPEFASVGHIDTLGSALSSNNCNGKPLNEHNKNETEAFVIADSPDVNNCAMSPVAFLDSRSLSEFTDARSHNFTSPEANVGPLDEFHIEKLHAMAGASPADHINLLEHFHAELVTKDSNVEFESHHVGESHGFYAKKGPPSSLSHGNAQGHGLSSSSQDHSYVSYSQLAIISDYYPEIMSPTKHPSSSKTTDISPSCLLPEPAILVEKDLEEKSTVDCVSFSSNNIKQSSESVIDKMQALKLSHTVDGSKCGHQRDHVEHSSVSCSDHSMEVNAGFAVLPGISMSTNEELGSSRVLLSSSLATNSLSHSTPRVSILPKLDNDKVLEGHNRNFIQPYSRSCTSNAISSSVSMSNDSYDVQVVSASQSMGLASEDLVSSSLITEPKIQGCVSQETPLPPPLPPLNWWLTRSHKRSVPSTKAEAVPAFPAPPAPPPPPSLKHSRPAQRSQSQNTCIERNDSLIKAIASHDKSTLRKVIQQSQSLKARPVNEREELLEQIRTRSFSLRQTAVKKHKIPSPATNINVSAILEKACAIRQAFVGSEDDEDDDWSDD